ncbi:MAG: hypothetical protein LC775_11735 [Acidobacteria bacterium]|nr:hypothetical protein [Acidobacteriota bacterium]
MPWCDGDYDRVVMFPAAPTRRQVLWLGVAMFGLTLTGDAGPIRDRRIAYGAHADNEPWPDLLAHYALETMVGAKLSMMSWFQNWDTPWLIAQAEHAASTGHDIQLCWEPVRAGAPVAFSDILAGRHDNYLRRFFSDAAQYPGRVWIRPFHEMNGNWYPWSLAKDLAAVVASAKQWIAAWRHLVGLQRSVGGDRVGWMWCPNNIDVGGVAAESYYPGSGYVDILGVDAYNGYGRWETPYELINPMYQRLVRLHTTAPVVVAEIGSREAKPTEPHSKAVWLQQLFTETRFPRLTHVNFFSVDKERDWRLNSSPQALAIVRKYLGDCLSYDPSNVVCGKRIYGAPSR